MFTKSYFSETNEKIQNLFFSVSKLESDLSLSYQYFTSLITSSFSHDLNSLLLMLLVFL